MEITRIEQSRQRLDSVYIDGKFAGRISRELLASCRLDVGSQIQPEQFTELMMRSNCERARDKALWLLGNRPHTQKELLDKLSRSFPREAAEYAVERMRNLGFVDDADFARQYAAELAQRRSYAASRIVQELCRRGIERELAKETAERLALEPARQINSLLQNKFSRTLQAPNGREKVAAALRRYGFEWSDISQCLEEWADVHAETKDVQNDGQGSSDYSERIRFLLETKFSHSLRTEKDRRHAVSALVARGFSRLHVERVLNDLIEENI